MFARENAPASGADPGATRKPFTVTANHKIVASLTGAALLVALVVVLSFWAFSQIEESAAARLRTYTLISAANAVLSDMKDAETGQRGYSLTGDEAFLKPYLAVRDTIDGNLQELRKLTSLKAASDHLDALVPLVDAKPSVIEKPREELWIP